MSAPVALTADEIDDLLYFTRAHETQELQQAIAELATKYQSAARDIITACIDPTTSNTLLHYSAANGFNDLLPSLLAPTADAPLATNVINHQNREGNTPLHWAAYNGHLDAVKLLVAAGADMWVKNAAGHLAMFEAERADKSDVVQFLLESGGDAVEESGAEGQASVGDVEDMEKEQNGEGSSAHAG